MAILVLREQDAHAVFTVRDVLQQTAVAGTEYAEATVAKTMQRMKREPEPECSPFVRLERMGRAGFRLVETEAS